MNLPIHGWAFLHLRVERRTLLRQAVDVDVVDGGQRGGDVLSLHGADGIRVVPAHSDTLLILRAGVDTGDEGVSCHLP